MTLTFRAIETHGSELEQEYRLRNEILRIPLNLVFHLTPEQIEAETRDFHYGLFDGNGEMHACVIATPFEPGKYQIRQMAVIERQQGNGLGKVLLTKTEQALRDHGATELMLQARDVAIGFYDKLGYERVGEMFTHVGIPHLEMRKKL